MSSVKLPDWIDDDETIRFYNGTVHKLPPWTGNDRAMRLWLEERMLTMREAKLAELAEKWNNRDHAFETARALKSAKYGYIQPLRDLYPDHAEFINLPKRGHGKRFPPMPDWNPIVQAALEAKRIRALWKKFYPGRRRRLHDHTSAEEFAAEIWTKSFNFPNVTTDQIRNRLKKKLPPSK